MSSNTDLQATHQIIGFLEEAKAKSETVLDLMPGLFLVIDSKGLVYRGNRILADFLEVPFEEIGGCQFDQKIGKEAWEIFCEMIKLPGLTAHSGVDFEINLSDQASGKKNYMWNLRPLEFASQNRQGSELYALIGRDVTEVKTAAEHVTRMQSELITAKTVQDTLFPDTELNFINCAVSGYYQPATECGGDWWFHNFIDEKVFLWIGDVTGHGVGAAMVASSARSTVAILETVTALTPATALTYLNKAIFSTSKSMKLMSFCVVSIDLKTGSCCYSVAGHETPILIKKTNDVSQIHHLPSQPSCLLGQESSPQFVNSDFKLLPGDRLFLATDGVNELKNNKRMDWGARRANKVILQSSNKSRNPGQFVEELKNEMSRFQDGEALHDDVTFLMFEMRKYLKTN